LIEGDRDNFIDRKNLDPSSNVMEGSLNALMDFFSGPHLPVLEVLQNIDLAGSLRGVLKPSVQ
jgi:hypothetical protein